MRFTSSQDYNLAQHFNKELLNTFIDVIVVLYKLNVSETKVNVYGEGVNKQWYVGVQCPALVNLANDVVIKDTQLLDIQQQPEFYFLRQELQDRNIYPQIGDVVDFNDRQYEIDNTNEIQLWGGQPMHNHSIVCTTHLVRNTNLQFEPPVM